MAQYNQVPNLTAAESSVGPAVPILGAPHKEPAQGFTFASYYYKTFIVKYTFAYSWSSPIRTRMHFCSLEIVNLQLCAGT